jgi:acyl carrier protein
MTTADLVDTNLVASEHLEQVVRTAVACALERPVDQVLPESDLEKDLGLDSLGLIQVNVALEEELEVAVHADDNPESPLNTVADLTAFVAAKIGIARGEE